ncbi:MAG: phenylalanine--tRNA ligase subunit beta [Thermofilaceae archaeon]|nr:phenylalanine--tRNA ligase subunit beta [Thermofilaceae archaeon]MCX8180725.1 phenylalanine--tRNA ligase subunit beta [Thermofilaceae archaeon]MDW8003943.1 phenylalanine--tRNA ligase subunit beta [Thermofilaceae archaeon]
MSVFDLSRLVGSEISLDSLQELLPQLKCELERIEGGYVEYEVTHDRPDLFSAEGLSRALKGLLEIEKGLRVFQSEKVGLAINQGPEYRPYVLFVTVHGLRLDDESITQFMQLQEKLHATYGRDRRKVSIGVYDLSKVSFPVKYVKADPRSVRFTPLEFSDEMTLEDVLKRHPKGVQYSHLIQGEKWYPLLVDGKGTVLSMPPIVNSEDTKVTEQTRDVLIDVTSTDLKAAENILSIMATSLAERGERIGLVEVQDSMGTRVLNLEPREVRLEVSLVERVSGVCMKTEEVVEYLQRMRLGAVPNGEAVKVFVPAYRFDIIHPVDLVEEAIMGYGFNRLAHEFMQPQHPGREHPINSFSRRLRELVAGFGFQEVSNYMLTCKEVLYVLMEAPENPTVEVLNPRQSQYSCLRTWLIPQLLQVLANSKHADFPQKIFECGDVTMLDEREDNMVREERRIALTISDNRVTLNDIHAIIDSLLRLLGLQYTLRTSEHPSFIKGRFASIEVQGITLGYMGEVHPKVLVNWGLEKPVVAAEISVDGMFTTLYGKSSS